MPRLRLQDFLFGAFCLVVVTMSMFDIQVAVLAFLGAFACGSLYVFAGMLPSPTESFGRRVFTSVFLSIVLSSLVLIVPGTFGAQMLRPSVEHVVILVAGLIPAVAICFEIIRTPRIIQGIRRCLGQR